MFSLASAHSHPSYAPCTPSTTQVGRSGRAAGASAEMLSELLAGAPGVTITITAADASCAADGAALLDAGGGGGGAGALVHASGVLADAALAGQTFGGLRRWAICADCWLLAGCFQWLLHCRAPSRDCLLFAGPPVLTDYQAGPKRPYL